MSRGRPDYNIKVVPIIEKIGDDEERFVSHRTGSVPAASYTDVTIYNIPSDEEVYVTFVRISVDTTTQLAFQIYEGSTLLFGSYLNTEISLNLAGGAGLYVQPGYLFKIRISNGTAGAVIYIITVLGYKRIIA